MGCKTLLTHSLTFLVTDFDFVHILIRVRTILVLGYWVLVSLEANIIGYWILGAFLGIVLTLILICEFAWTSGQ